MSVQILQGCCLDILPTLAAESVQCVVTSPPYWGLRDYDVAGQFGLEDDFEDYLARMVEVFEQVKRVLKKDGTLWLNMGDCYSSGGRENKGKNARASFRRDKMGLTPPCSPAPFNLPPKNLIGQPWRLAFALQAAGWILRSDIIWHKPTAMPESIHDRPTKAHEYLFLMTKSGKYFYDKEAIMVECSSLTNPRGKGVSAKIKEPDGWDTGKGAHTSIHRQGRGKGRTKPRNNPSFALATNGKVEMRNARTVWTIPSAKFKEAHFATFPPALVERCINAGTKEGDLVLDPFGGAGTTALAADRLGRDALLIELNPDYVAMAKKRIMNDAPLFIEIEATT